MAIYYLFGSIAWLNGHFAFGTSYVFTGTVSFEILAVKLLGPTNIWILSAPSLVFLVFFVNLDLTKKNLSRHIEAFINEQQAKTISALYEEFQLNANDWVWEIDANSRITHISNILIEKQMQFDREVRKFDELFSPDEPTTNSLIGFISRQQEFSSLVVHPSSLTEFPGKAWELRGRPVYDFESKFVGFRGFARDVSDLHHLQQLRLEQVKFETLSKFAAKIAHDFNNSLMVLQSNVEYIGSLFQHEQTEESLQIFQTIDEVIYSVSSINNELLSYTRQEVFRPERLSLLKLIEVVAENWTIW